MHYRVKYISAVLVGCAEWLLCVGWLVVIKKHLIAVQVALIIQQHLFVPQFTFQLLYATIQLTHSGRNTRHLNPDECEHSSGVNPDGQYESIQTNEQESTAFQNRT